MTRALSEPATTRIRWKGASRLIPSRYPSVGLFDRIVSPEDLDATIGWHEQLVRVNAFHLPVAHRDNQRP